MIFGPKAMIFERRPASAPSDRRAEVVALAPLGLLGLRTLRNRSPDIAGAL